MWPFTILRSQRLEIDSLQQTVKERDECIARLLRIIHDWERRYPLPAESLLDNPHTGIR